MRFSSDKICNLLLQSSVVNLHFSKHTIICTHFRLYFKNCKKFQAITYSSSETPPDICFPQWYISTLSCSSNQQQAAWDLIWALNTLLSSVITYRNILLSTQVTFSRLTNRTLTHMYIHITQIRHTLQSGKPYYWYACSIKLHTWHTCSITVMIQNSSPLINQLL